MSSLKYVGLTLDRRTRIAILKYRPCVFTERLIHLKVAYPSRTTILAVIKRLVSSVGAVYELVQYDNVPRVYVFPEGATGCRGDDVRAALLAKSVNVGSVVDVAWHVLVFATVSAGVEIIEKGEERVGGGGN